MEDPKYLALCVNHILGPIINAFNNRINRVGDFDASVKIGLDGLFASARLACSLGLTVHQVRLTCSHMCMCT